MSSTNSVFHILNGKLKTFYPDFNKLLHLHKLIFALQFNKI